MQRRQEEKTEGGNASSSDERSYNDTINAAEKQRHKNTPGQKRKQTSASKTRARKRNRVHSPKKNDDSDDSPTDLTERYHTHTHTRDCASGMNLLAYMILSSHDL